MACLACVGFVSAKPSLGQDSHEKNGKIHKQNTQPLSHVFRLSRLLLKMFGACMTGRITTRARGGQSDRMLGAVVVFLRLKERLLLRRARELRYGQEGSEARAAASSPHFALKRVAGKTLETLYPSGVRGRVNRSAGSAAENCAKT